MSDIVESLSHVARPWLLTLIAMPILWVILKAITKHQDHRRWKQLGEPVVLARFISGHRRPGRWLVTCIVLAWTLLSFALAGPRWGVAENSGIAVGRDVVIVLDVSRSMWAEDMATLSSPARWQAAVAGAKDLVATSRRRGGDRIGIMIFAARPFTVAPLTTDYDHLMMKLENLDARHPPADVRPATDDAVSGTRIGTALKAAVELHDARFPGFQEIVLFTDGDDPAADGEWKAGVTAARHAAIPVHVVGLGDANRDSFILRNGEPIEGPTPDGARAQIQTRLHEDVARAIAEESRGVYLPARTDVPNLGEFYRSAVLSNSSREVSDERRLLPQDRAASFYAAALLLLMLAWCWPVRKVS